MIKFKLTSSFMMNGLKSYRYADMLRGNVLIVG